MSSIGHHARPQIASINKTSEPNLYSACAKDSPLRRFAPELGIHGLLVNFTDSHQGRVVSIK